MASPARGTNGIPVLEITVDSRNRQNLVTLVGEVDLSTCPQMSGSLAPLLLLPQSVIIDLSEVSFLDSSGLSALVQCREQLAVQGRAGDLHVVIVPGPVQRVFEITGLTGIFQTYATLADAVAAS